MTTRIPLAATLASAVLALIAGCGSDSPDGHLYAAAVCVDSDGIRVPDSYCPIGDGIDNAGNSWAYHEYRDTDPDVDVVFVGYPVDRHIYVHDRPRRVPTLNIDRGRFPERPATMAATGASSARVVTIAQERKTSTIARGGLGTPAARNAEAPRPARTLDSPAPGRAATARPIPPAPKTRPVAKTNKRR